MDVSEADAQRPDPPAGALERHKTEPFEPTSSRIPFIDLLRSAGSALPLYLATGAILLFALGTRLWLMFWRFFDNDELLAVHGAWALAHGQILYRDFFETHPPWLHFVLLPLFWLFRPDTDASRANALLFTARGIMLATTAGIVLTTFRLGKKWRNPRIAALAAALLVTTFAFQEKTLEIRPDVPATLLLLTALVVAVGPHSSAPDTLGSIRGRAFVSGVLLGSALMFTTKAVFAVPGFIVGVAMLTNGERETTGRDRLERVLLTGVGAILPALVTCAFFLAVGGLHGLIYDLVVSAGRWPRLNLQEVLSMFLMQNTALLALGAIGCKRLGAMVVTGRQTNRSDPILFFPAVSLLAGLLLSPSTYLQYHLLYLPLFALFAASAISDLADFVFGRVEHRRPGRGAAVIVVLTCSGLATYTWILLHGQDAFPDGFFDLRRHTWALLFEFAVVLIALWVVARVGLSRTTALTTALAVLVVVPMHRLVAWETFSNNGQLAEIAYVIRNSKVSDAVLDGYSGVGAFRRQAFGYFLAVDAQPMVPLSERKGLERGLLSEAIKPTIIVLDWPLRFFLAQDALAAIRRDYEVVLRRNRISPFDPTGQQILKRREAVRAGR